MLTDHGAGSRQRIVPADMLPDIVAFGISKKNLTHIILYLHSPGWFFLICFPEIGKPVYAAYAHAAAKNIANGDRQEVCE